MHPILKLYSSYVEYLFAHAIAGEHWNKSAPNRPLIREKITSTLLAKELEEATQKDGFLTYEEFLTISQFGKYGYYNTHTHHGMTNSFLRWPSPILSFLKQENIHHMLEFGCGDGKLAAEILALANQQHYPLTWTGIEVSLSSLQDAEKLFQKKQLPKDMYICTHNAENIVEKERTLLLFSYSLDSIPVQQFINTEDFSSFPTTVVGVTIRNGILQEIALSKEQLKKKSLDLKDGIFRTETKNVLDLSSWSLEKGQRLFLPTKGATIIADFVQKLPKDSFLLIIDEYYFPPLSFDKNHRALPKDLDKFMLNRETKHLSGEYKNAGKNLLYYPSFLKTYVSLLESCGCEIEDFGNEYKISAGFPIKQKKEFGACLAIIAKKTKPVEKQLVLAGY